MKHCAARFLSFACDGNAVRLCLLRDTILQYNPAEEILSYTIGNIVVIYEQLDEHSSEWCHIHCKLDKKLSLSYTWKVYFEFTTFHDNHQRIMPLINNNLCDYRSCSGWETLTIWYCTVTVVNLLQKIRCRTNNQNTFNITPGSCRFKLNNITLQRNASHYLQHSESWR